MLPIVFYSHSVHVFSSALFLLDAWCCVYLWCGWWPVHAEDGKPTASTGMATDHWLKDKELGMKTATDYAKCTNYVLVFCTWGLSVVFCNL